MWLFCSDSGGQMFWETRFSKAQSRKMVIFLAWLVWEVKFLDLKSPNTGTQSLKQKFGPDFSHISSQPLSSVCVIYIPQIVDDAILLKCLL